MARRFYLEEVIDMKKKIFAMISVILCFASLLTCTSCASEDTEFESGSGMYGSDTNSATDMKIENIVLLLY